MTRRRSSGLVEQSHLPTRRTLWKLGIPRSSLYRWYDRYQRGGPEGLADRPSRPDRVWNRIPEAIRNQIVDLALDQPEPSPRELAVRFTDEDRIFCLGGLGLSAAESARSYYQPGLHRHQSGQEEFKDKTTAPNQLLRQTDFTYLKITGWGWCYLSTVLDDFLALHCRLEALCDHEGEGRHRHPRSGVGDFPGLDQTDQVVHRPRLLSDNGASYVAEDLAQWL